MTAYEMMLSESQERMLMVLKPGKEKRGRGDLRKWGLDFAIIGKTTDTLRFVVQAHSGEVMADLPIKELGDEAPVYDRPHTSPTPAAGHRARERRAPMLERRRAAEAHRLARPLLASAGSGSSTTT